MNILQRFITVFLLAFSSSLAIAVDTFDLSTSMLTVPKIAIGTTEYSNISATIGQITVIGIGSALPVTPSMDVFDPRTNILTIPDLMVGSSRYRNVQVQLGIVTVNSLGSTTTAFEPPPTPGP